ncbi:class I SAM-dependent methyltransferase [Saccharibacillus kuerlensis]|uniref:Methyltransferase type 11 domain-containing protein n=1 Tax=Saccharibacillus kuerlensis TaxID=459527 RepID=A0ABQ2L390_9BACL|nr:class I SAM-dependent methyltransferase [Saccharibacillus kuerlensis]GGO01067.1 hypothetical protein GCM10010969_22950 [Saccharibacillus kuerlensis]
MGKWFVNLYDPFMAPFEKKKFKTIRKHLIQQAEGHVLEIGSGTGVNFPFYKEALHVTRVTAIEPDPSMLDKSLSKIKDLSKVHAYLGDAQKLPFPDHTFDTVVGTLVFCTIPDPEKALSEIQRVLKPEGKLLLFEHVRLNHFFLSRLQDLLTPLWKQVCHGCCLNRNTLQIVTEAGFHAKKVDSTYKGLFLTMELISSKS